MGKLVQATPVPRGAPLPVPKVSLRPAVLRLLRVGYRYPHAVAA